MSNKKPNAPQKQQADFLPADIAHRFGAEWKLHFSNDYSEIVQAIPDPEKITASEVKQALARHGYRDIDPDKVFFHLFNGAVSSSRSYNGWAHYEQPLHSYTLTQSVMLNVFNEFRDTSPGTINTDTGVYTEGFGAKAYDEHNEVRLLSSTLWDIAYKELDIQSSYDKALAQFWLHHGERYTQLMRDGYAFSAHQQYRLGLLNQAQYQLAQTLLKPSRHDDIHVYRFDIYGYDSTDILLIEQGSSGDGLLYIPGASQPFVPYSSERQLKKFLFKQLKKANQRSALARHFSLKLRQDGVTYSGVDSALLGFSTGSWDESYFMMKHHPVNGDVFARLTEQWKARLTSDGDTAIKSNSEALRDYLLGASYTLMSVFPVIDVILPEFGIPLSLAVGVTQLGLSLDTAVNGDTLAERQKGTKMSIVNAALLGATTVIPSIVQYGRALSGSLQGLREALPNAVLESLGISAEELAEFQAMPKIIVHPHTGEELLGVRLTDSQRGALLRADGFGYYREVDPMSGRLLTDSRVVRTLDFDTGEPQWLSRGGLKGGNPEEEITSEASMNNLSERSEILLPEDLPTRPGMGGSGYAEMDGGRDSAALRDFYELESRVNPNARLTDVRGLHSANIRAQQEILSVPFLAEYEPGVNKMLVFRGDTRLPDEIFHSGFNRRAEPVEYIRHAHHTVGIRGVISTSSQESIAVNYALHQQRGYVYAIELNHGGKVVETSLRGETLHEIATLNIPPEDIIFAVGPFNQADVGYADVIEKAENRSAELLINPHAVSSSDVASHAFDRLKNTLKYQLSPELPFAERYDSRVDLLWYEDEVEETLPVG
ncbi:MAG: hypothetical protein RL248_190 [Pseudomonadota bacterium]